ncbi:hypothetical protein AQUCO_10000016v1 [Aquilegia coerulea]|uniref:Acetylajmalan esterase-like n=1 Tax=Aquilegia coerulea TaxID=218851 RepID=A0A2G5C444_AQUCA|nr:hypothetical protein AQUCO_10000016v1 [Aquilegia coerulea]
MGRNMNFFACFVLILFPCTAFGQNTCFFDAIYQFGDSISDTGNFIRESSVGASTYGRLPYGMTYFQKPTGRCSDGRLMIDFIASSFGLPYLNAYLDKYATFNNGVNFAVAASTALDTSVLRSKGIQPHFTNSSLSVQLGWFKNHLKTICSTETDCKKKLENSLFMIGEIGGNDYIYVMTMQLMQQNNGNFLKFVLQSSNGAMQEVIHLGARYVVVPGEFPVGCFPVFLSPLQNIVDQFAYDGLNCIPFGNMFAMYHNAQLIQAIAELKEEFPNVKILYADYYSAFLRVLQNAGNLGLEQDSLMKTCCGDGGGEHNFNFRKMCGQNGSQVCQDPGKRVSWDGIHLTEKAYKGMADWLINNLKPQLNCN